MIGPPVNQKKEKNICIVLVINRLAKLSIRNQCDAINLHHKIV